MASVVPTGTDEPLRCNRSERHFTVGVEEEFIVCDPVTGRPSLTGPAVAASDLDLQPELSSCQVETCTPVCDGIPELHQELRRARTGAVQAASRSGVQLLATGVPVWRPPAGSVTETPRYQQLSKHFGVLAEQVICGAHVHIGVSDRELGVQIANHLRPWLPTLLALTANSPITDGADTGYASWRHVLWSRWPNGGPPPYFRSAQHYDETVAMLRASECIIDPAMVYWDVRLSTHLPTIEIRVSDVPSTVAETILLASLVRALVASAVTALDAGEVAAPLDQTQLRVAYWRAARDGISGSAVDPGTQRLIPATTSLERLLTHVRPYLEESGDYERTKSTMQAVIADGNGAVRQRRAFRTGGPAAVAEVVARLTTEGIQETPSAETDWKNNV